jgi:nicotinate-nucleotide adenylyltransferase
MRVGLFGGSFDPVHLGHLMLADAAFEQARLDRVLFVPAGRSPLKRRRPAASDEARLEMLRLATAGHPGFSVCDTELRRGGISFTLDTLTALRALPEWKGAAWHLILGMDAWIDFPRWHRPDALIRMARLLVAARPSEGRPRPAPGRVPPAIARRTRFLSMPPVGISSSAVRKRVAQGRSIRYWVPEPVERFIRDGGVYR